MTGVVYGWPLEGLETASCEGSWAGQEFGAVGLLHVVQALAAARERAGEPAGGRPAPHLWALTQRAQAVTAGESVRPRHATIWGLRRVIANEHPELVARIADLDDHEASYAALPRELERTLDDDELAFRDGKRFVHRLVRYLPEEEASESGTLAIGGPRMELKVHKPGDLNSMGWVELPEFNLGEQEVEIEVHATALNFKDVMKATGLFPTRLIEGNLWSRETIGMECAGRVRRVGARVCNVRPGDEVLALAPRAFASHAVTHSALVVPNPGLSPEAGAGLPVAFLTAAVGLELMANLQPGERVLIHAASGGVGQAAIQLAQLIGAEVFATAGSESKRKLVRDLGVEHVFDSRSLRFAEDIRQATGGEGVDVVLNSLAGEAIWQSLSVLRDYGRFVELGKMDLDRDFALRLRPFTRCLSFHAVDLDRMLAQRVELCGKIMRDLYQRFAAGQLRALPVSVTETLTPASAFLHMASATHTGKLVLRIDPSSVQIGRRESVRFRDDASYLVTGGLGGFGLQLALWLAKRGAGHLVLLGRRGMRTPGAEAACDALRALGASVQVEACDVALAADVARALGGIPADKPLRGVFHAAAVLDDALIKNLDLERFQRTFAAKAEGAWHLHEQTKQLPLEHFMCFSSMASVLGNQGSANYCAANAFVDALAHMRRAQGLPALTVNWGVIADVGMAADEDFYRQNLERNGLTTIHSSHCLEMLGLLLLKERVQTTVCPIDFETWLRFNPAGREGRLVELVHAGHKAGAQRSQTAEESALRAGLAERPSSEHAAIAQAAIRSLLAQVFRTDPARIDESRSLTALGADSLMAIEIKNRLEALGLALSVTQLLNRNSVATLAGMLLDTLGYSAAGPSAAVAPAPEAGSPWFVRRAAHEDGRLRLFCFPYAGGGPAVYHRWQELLPSWIEVIAINLPGRGLRADEENLASIPLSADTMLQDMLPLLDRPFAMFGHCMGAILMYEVAERLQRQHGKRAAHIFASGCMAPHLYNSPIVHEQADPEFLDVLRLISFSGTRALIEDPELRGSTFPLLRGDFRAVAEYGDTFEVRPPLESPITGIAADRDLFAAPKAMEAWGSYSALGYELFELSGDHYFVESDRELVARLVSARLLPVNGEPSALPELPGVSLRRPDNSCLGQLPAQPRSGASAPLAILPEAKPLRVLCFPPAGIRAAEMPLPDSDSELHYSAIEWRGKSERDLPTSVAEFVEHAYEAVQKHLQGPTIFYGHCLGALVAYELALRLRSEGRALPEQLLVAGTVGPHLYVAPDAQKLPKSKMLELLGVLKYPFASQLKSDGVFCDERLPVLYADLGAMASYQYETAEPLSIPITAISLRHDLWSYPLRTESWKHHTTADFEVVEWEGDHYECLRRAERIDALVRSFGARAIAAE